MGYYKESESSRRGERVTIYCSECGEEVTGQIVGEKYWGYSSFLEEVGDTLIETVTGEHPTLLMVVDDDGETHEGEEVG